MLFESTGRKTITVGIPAHNEEANIAHLLDAVFSQKGDFILEKIMVAADGCTDRTEKIAGDFARTHPEVRLLSGKNRIGKSRRLNEIYQMNESDFLITLDADIEMENNSVFEKLLAPFSDPSVAVAAGNARPLPGRTFVEKLLFAKDAWWYEARKNFKGGNNIYASAGCCFALKKDFAKSLEFKNGTVNDQEIIYLEAMRQGKRFIFAKDAKIYFRDASTWAELLSRAKRFEHRDDLAAYDFGIDIEAEYRIPVDLKLKGFWKEISKNPFYSIASLFLALGLKVLPFFQSGKLEKNNPELWDITASTKKLREAGAKYDCRIIYDLNEEMIRDWKNLWKKSAERNYFNSPEFFIACREAFGIKKFAIILIYRGGILQAILPLAERRVFGIKTFATPGSAGNYIDKSSFLVNEPSDEIVNAAFSAARSLGNVFIVESGQKQASAVESQRMPCLIRNASLSRFIAFDENADVLQFMSKGEQRELRRRMRHVSGDIEFQIKGIEALETVIKIEKRSHKPRRHMALFGKKYSERFLRSLAKHMPGSVRIGILHLKGEPIASILGFANEAISYWYHVAFIEKYRRLGPGKMALYLMLADLKKEGFAEIDFLRGDSDLKRQFAKSARLQYDLYFYKNRYAKLRWKLCLAIWGTLKKTELPIEKKNENKKRIIFSNYDDIKNPHYAGGGAAAIHEVAKRLAPRFDIIVLTGNYPGAKNERIDGVFYKRIGPAFLGPYLGQLLYHFYLLFFVSVLKYDLWIESFTPPISTSLTSLFAYRSVIGLAHMLSGEDMRRKYKFPFQAIESAGLKFYSDFIVMTDEDAKNIKIQNPSARIHILGNGVSVPNFENDTANLERKHLSFMGRVELEQKGLDLLLEAYAIVREDFSLPLVIAGTGIKRETDKLQNMIRQCGIEDGVRLAGRLQGKAKDEFLRTTAIGIVPSRYESFSLVALEMMAYGIPIVCFDIPGLRWIPRGAALRAENHSAEDLAKAIVKFLNDSENRRLAAESGREEAKRRDWNIIAKNYESVINGLLP